MPPGIPRQFSGNEVLLTVVGVSISEFAIGTMASIELENDDTVATQGHNGSILLSENPNDLATLTFTVMQGSADNAALSAAVAIKASEAFLFEDLNGTTRVSAIGAKIKKRPAAKAVTEGEGIEWTFWVYGITEWTIGSNLPAV